MNGNELHLLDDIVYADGMHHTQLIYSGAAGFRPHFNGANSWIVFLDAAVVINAATVVIQFMAYGINANCIFLVNDILFERMLGRTQIRQYFVDLLK